MKTNKELKKIAMDYLAGKIFTSHQVERDNDLGIVFMPLLLMDKKQRSEFIEKHPVMVFEYISKAGPSSINGMPCFTSFDWLNKKEHDIFIEYYDKIKKAVEDVK